MNPIEIAKGVLGLVLVAALLWAGHDYLQTKEDNSVMHNVIEQADAIAKENADKYKNTFDEVTNENDTNRNTIIDYYDRLLHTKDIRKGGGATQRPTRPDGAASEHITCERDIGFEKACALDAQKVMRWQEWAIKNEIPVAQ